MERHVGDSVPVEDPGDEYFIEWLNGRQELALLGSESRSDFLRSSLEDMVSRGLMLRPDRFAVLITVTFGSIDRLLDELREFPLEEFSAKYPSIASFVASWHQGTRDVKDPADMPMIKDRISNTPEAPNG